MQVLAQIEYQRGLLHSWHLSLSPHSYLILPFWAIFAALVLAISVSEYFLQCPFCRPYRSKEFTNNVPCTRWSGLPQDSRTTRKSASLDRGQIEFARSPPTLYFYGPENIWEVWSAAYHEHGQRRRKLIHWIHGKTGTIVPHSGYGKALSKQERFIIILFWGSIVYFKRNKFRCTACRTVLNHVLRALPLPVPINFYEKYLDY